MLVFMLMLALVMLSFMLTFLTIKFHDHRDLAGVFVDIIARVILILRQKRGQQVSLSTFFGTIKRSATQHSPFATKRKPTIIQLPSNQLKLDGTDPKKTQQRMSYFQVADELTQSELVLGVGSGVGLCITVLLVVGLWVRHAKCGQRSEVMMIVMLMMMVTMMSVVMMMAMVVVIMVMVLLVVRPEI